MSLPRRLLLLALLLVLLFVACALLYVAVQTRNAFWLLGSLAVFAVLITAWIRTLIAVRRRARRARAAGPDRSAAGPL